MSDEINNHNRKLVQYINDYKKRIDDLKKHIDEQNNSIMILQKESVDKTNKIKKLKRKLEKTETEKNLLEIQRKKQFKFQYDQNILANHDEYETHKRNEILSLSGVSNCRELLINNINIENMDRDNCINVIRFPFLVIMKTAIHSRETPSHLYLLITEIICVQNQNDDRDIKGIILKPEIDFQPISQILLSYWCHRLNEESQISQTELKCESLSNDHHHKFNNFQDLKRKCVLLYPNLFPKIKLDDHNAKKKIIANTPAQLVKSLDYNNLDDNDTSRCEHLKNLNDLFLVVFDENKANFFKSRNKIKELQDLYYYTKLHHSLYIYFKLDKNANGFTQEELQYCINQLKVEEKQKDYTRDNLLQYLSSGN